MLEEYINPKNSAKWEEPVYSVLQVENLGEAKKNNGYHRKLNARIRKDKNGRLESMAKYGEEKNYRVLPKKLSNLKGQKEMVEV